MVSTVVPMDLAIGLVFGLGLETELWMLARMGTLGLSKMPLWIRVLGRLLCRQGHIMAAGFRSTSP